MDMGAVVEHGIPLPPVAAEVVAAAGHPPVATQRHLVLWAGVLFLLPPLMLQVQQIVVAVVLVLTVVTGVRLFLVVALVRLAEAL